MIFDIIKYKTIDININEEPLINYSLDNPILLGNSQKNFFSSEQIFLNKFPSFLLNENNNIRKEQNLDIFIKNIQAKNSAIYLKNNSESQFDDDSLNILKNKNDINSEQLFFLDFISNAKNNYSIDPLSLLLNDENITKDLFGTKLGGIIFSIINEISNFHNKKNQKALFNTQSIFDIINLDNLYLIYTDELFYNSSSLIKDYFINDLNINIENFYRIDRYNIEKHLSCSSRANLILNSIKYWEDEGLFSLEPNLDLVSIMNNNQALFINTYTKNGFNINPLSINDVIMYNIIKAAQVSNNSYNNIIIDNILYESYSEELITKTIEQSKNKDNWILSFSHLEQRDNLIKLLFQSNTILLSNIYSNFSKNLIKEHININNNLKKIEKENKHLLIYYKEEPSNIQIIKK